MFLVVFFNLRENQNIIDVTNNKVVQNSQKDIIHQMLEYGLGIRQVKRHNIVFEVFIPCPKCYLPFVTFFYLN